MGELPRASLLLLASSLTRLAAHCERECSQASFGNLAGAFRTRSVLARLEPDEGLVDTGHRIRPQLNQSQLDFSLVAGVGTIEVVTDFVPLVQAPGAHATLNPVLHVTPAFAQHLLEFYIPIRHGGHVRLQRYTG